MDPSQTTLQHPQELKGISLFSGNEVTIRLLPAKAGEGIYFVRTDLPEEPKLEALVDSVISHPFNCTAIGNEEIQIHTIEHLLAALYAMGIDNACIEIDGAEVPIFDGSSKLIVEAIEKAGIQELGAPKEFYELQEPVYYEDGHVSLVALPAEQFQVSYTWHYPKSKNFNSQYFSAEITKQLFVDQISFCRTFAFYEDISLLLKKNQVKGASLEQGILIRDDRVVNELGLRTSSELVRHKVLDLIGDIALIGKPLKAHIIAIRSGHKSNAQLAKKIKEQASVSSLCLK